MGLLPEGINNDRSEAIIKQHTKPHSQCDYLIPKDTHCDQSPIYMYRQTLPVHASAEADTST